MNFQSAIIEGTKILQERSIHTSQLDTEILLAKAIGKDKKYIILNNYKNLQDKSLKYFKKLINERASRKPIAHIINKKFFWNSEFYVTNDTLIPRPDTELIIEQILNLTKYNEHTRYWSWHRMYSFIYLKGKKKFYGTGIDISKNCLNISKINAIKLKVGGRIRFYKTDVDKFTQGKYDLIVSNPPYINKFDLKYLEKDVANLNQK